MAPLSTTLLASFTYHLRSSPHLSTTVVAPTDRPLGGGATLHYQHRPHMDTANMKAGELDESHSPIESQLPLLSDPGATFILVLWVLVSWVDDTTT